MGFYVFTEKGKEHGCPTRSLNIRSTNPLNAAGSSGSLGSLKSKSAAVIAICGEGKRTLTSGKRCFLSFLKDNQEKLMVFWLI